VLGRRGLLLVAMVAKTQLRRHGMRTVRQELGAIVLNRLIIVIWLLTLRAGDMPVLTVWWSIACHGSKLEGLRIEKNWG
jgi:hypothetical protein